MNPSEGAHFVGAYASFPVEAANRRVEILRSILALEDKLLFKRIRYGPILGKLSTVSFNEGRLKVAVDSLANGDSDYLQLFPYEKGEDWVHAYETSVHIDWKSAVSTPTNATSSPVKKRFGDAGSVSVFYPRSRFLAESESPFQERLLDVMRKLWSEDDLHWAFVNQGFHPLHPYSVGQDDMFRATRNSVPITSFNANLHLPVGIYREWVGGAFWANFLSPLHIERLGGTVKIQQERPCEIIDRLGKDGFLFQVAASPVTNETTQSAGKYQRLRRFFAPILMETGEDMMRIQKEILGSWRPPADAGRKWQEDLAVIRKQNP